jgi:hypothetical protein
VHHRLDVDVGGLDGSRRGFVARVVTLLILVLVLRDVPLRRGAVLRGRGAEDVAASCLAFLRGVRRGIGSARDVRRRRVVDVAKGDLRVTAGGLVRVLLERRPRGRSAEVDLRANVRPGVGIRILRGRARVSDLRLLVSFVVPEGNGGMASGGRVKARGRPVRDDVAAVLIGAGRERVGRLVLLAARFRRRSVGEVARKSDGRRGQARARVRDG